jgi:MoxR-like ATPase
VRCARARALLDGRDFVLPDDVKDVALAVLRHRVVLSPEAELEGRQCDDLLLSLLETVEAPRA